MDPINFFVLEMINYRKFKRSAQQEVDILICIRLFFLTKEREKRKVKSKKDKELTYSTSISHVRKGSKPTTDPLLHHSPEGTSWPLRNHLHALNATQARGILITIILKKRLVDEKKTMERGEREGEGVEKILSSFLFSPLSPLP
jgi:hypothetical protein